VISEEEYTSSLETIIQRDYFSDLPDLQLKAAVLNRRSQQDHVGAVRVRRAARRIKNREAALLAQDEADELSVDENGLRKKARPLIRESLSGFHGRVTSEDNVSFEQTQQREIKENRERLARVFQTPAERLMLKESEEQGDQEDTYDSPYPALASDEYNPPPSRISYTEWQKPQARNGLFFVPTPTAPARNSQSDQNLLIKEGLACSNDLSTSTQTDTSLMPPPSQSSQQTIISSVPATTSSAITSSERRALVEYTPKHTLEKTIEPSKTRFPVSREIATCLQEHRIITTLERLRNRKDSKDSDTEYSTDASTDLESDGRSLEAERLARARRQKREQESFVNMTPVIVPGNNTRLGDESPIVTCGTVAGTPLLIRPVEANGDEEEKDHKLSSNFNVADESDRDVAARVAMATLEQRKARAQGNNHSYGSITAAISSRKARDKPSKSRSKTRPASSSIHQRDISSFSPAARSLLAGTSSQKRALNVRSASSFASALRSSYTPQQRPGGSRLRGPSSNSLSRKDHVYGETPRLDSRNELAREETDKRSSSVIKGQSKPVGLGGESKSNHITDGLLNLL